MTIEETRKEINQLQQRQWNTTAEYIDAAADVIVRCLKDNPWIVRTAHERLLNRFATFPDDLTGDVSCVRVTGNEQGSDDVQEET